MLNNKNYKDQILSLSKIEFYSLFYKKFPNHVLDFENKMPFLHVFTYMNANYPDFLNEFVINLNSAMDAVQVDFLRIKENDEEKLNDILNSISPSAKIVQIASSFQIKEGIDTSNFLKLCSILKINTLGKNGHIPALFKFGKIVEVDESFISNLENKLNSSEPTIFGSTFFNSSSKNRFGFDPSKASLYKEHGLFGFENTLEGKEIEYDSVVEGGASAIPFKNLASMIHLGVLDIDLNMFFIKKEHQAILSQLVAIAKGIDPKKRQPRVSITDSSFKQILIPITKNNETNFLAISPLHATQARGIISDKIYEKNKAYSEIEKKKDFEGNKRFIPNTKSLSMASQPQNFTSQAKAITGSVLLSIAPSASISYLIKNQFWDIVANEVSSSGAAELFRHMSSALWQENKGKSQKDSALNRIKYLIHILDIGFKSKVQKDLLSGFIKKDALLKIKFIKESDDFSDYFLNAEDFAKNAEPVFIDSYIQYLKYFIKNIAPSTNAKRSSLMKDSVFDEIESIIISSIKEAWIESGFALHEITIKGLKDD